MQDLRIDHNLNPYWTHTSFDGLVATVQAGLRHNDGFGIGAEAAIGIFPTEDGGKQFDARAGVSPGIFGWSFIVRVKVPG